MFREHSTDAVVPFQPTGSDSVERACDWTALWFHHGHKKAKASEEQQEEKTKFDRNRLFTF